MVVPAGGVPSVDAHEREERLAWLARSQRCDSARARRRRSVESDGRLSIGVGGRHNIDDDVRHAQRKLEPGGLHHRANRRLVIILSCEGLPR